MERREGVDGVSWWWTTSPMTSKAGSGRDATSDERVQTSALRTKHCCCWRLPCVTTAMGVEDLSRETKWAAMSFNRRLPMNTTRVEAVPRAASKSEVRRPS